MWGQDFQYLKASKNGVYFFASVRITHTVAWKKRSRCDCGRIQCDKSFLLRFVLSKRSIKALISNVAMTRIRSFDNGCQAQQSAYGLCWRLALVVLCDFRLSLEAERTFFINFSAFDSFRVPEFSVPIYFLNLFDILIQLFQGLPPKLVLQAVNPAVSPETLP